MKELYAILDAWRDSADAQRDAVLATVVHVTGSAYRRPGARMLILPDGRRLGSVSGGCLEGEISKKAWWYTESGTPVVRVYDTTSDEDAAWEFGLGCNGVVHVMLERVNTPSARAMLEFLDAQREVRRPAVVATVIRTGPNSGMNSGIRVGDRLLLEDAEAAVAQGALAGSALTTLALAHAAAALREKHSRLVHIGETELFVEWIGPPFSLVVLGAGHDAIPVASIAQQLGWSITIADGRAAYAKSGRFPGADRVVVMPKDDPLAEVPIDSETAVVVMTHNYPLDRRLLPHILARRPRYLGLLGPKARADRLFSELGIDPPAWVHGPAGLDVGGDHPAAVALSIVSEIQAAMNQRSGEMLKRRRGSIHPPAAEVGRAAARDLMDAARPAYCETMWESHV